MRNTKSTKSWMAKAACLTAAAVGVALFTISPVVFAAVGALVSSVICDAMDQRANDP